MPFTVEINGHVVHADTAAEVRELVGGGTPEPNEPPKRPRKKPGPKPRKKADDDDDGEVQLTAAEKAALDAEVPLICRKPRGCGKPFHSENRKAWYCPKCAAYADEGRPV